MLEWIAKYWLEVLFGLIVAGMGVALREIWKMYKTVQGQEHDKEKKEILEIVDEKIDAQNEKMEKADQIIFDEIHNIEDGVNIITRGMLSVQGQSFRQACRRLLEPSHVITVDEYEQIVNDHETYHSLGGNHSGDKLFAQVEKKFENQAIQE